MQTQCNALRDLFARTTAALPVGAAMCEGGSSSRHALGFPPHFGRRSPALQLFGIPTLVDDVQTIVRRPLASQVQWNMGRSKRCTCVYLPASAWSCRVCPRSPKQSCGNVAGRSQRAWTCTLRHPSPVTVNGRNLFFRAPSSARSAQSDVLSTGSDALVPATVGTARVLGAARTPTKAEREENDVSHVPHRPWCRFCVTGRGRHLTQSGDRDDDRPRVFADYGYLSGDSTPLSVAKDRRTGMTFAAAVSMKGGGDPHAARLRAKWIDGLGCQEVTVRTDGEPSICELIRRGRELRAEGTSTVDEISPPGDSAGNGIAERAILTVGGLVRATKEVVEESVLEGLDAGPRLTAWMVHHAAQVICACMVGADGLTPFRRLKGRKFGTPLAGFGERVWLRDPVLERVNKFNPRCTQARLLGFCLKSSRYIVVDFDGRFRMVRAIKRANADDRWKVVSPRDPFSAADLESTPAEFTYSRGTRGEVNPAAQRLERHLVDALPPDPNRDPVPTRLYLKQSDIMAHGTSDRCPGCRALVSGAVHRATPRNVEFVSRENSGRQRKGKQPFERVMLPQGVH